MLLARRRRTCTASPRKAVCSTSAVKRLRESPSSAIASSCGPPNAGFAEVLLCRRSEVRSGQLQDAQRRIDRACFALAGARTGDEIAIAEEASATNASRSAIDLASRADLHRPAGVHHGETVGQREGLLLIVRDVHHCQARLAVQAADLLAHFVAQRGRRGWTSGSSSNSDRGSMTSARARATRCCCPPDSSLGRRSPNPPRC